TAFVMPVTSTGRVAISPRVPSRPSPKIPWLWPRKPQQRMVPVLSTAHVLKPSAPAVTETAVPPRFATVTGVEEAPPLCPLPSAPLVFDPQQRIEPSLITAHAWLPLVL